MVGRAHVDAALGQGSIELVAVVGPVAYQAEHAAADEASRKRFLDKRNFIARTTRDPNGDWKTASVCNCHDLCCGATASNSDESAPLLVPAWVPSMKDSVRSILPRSRRSTASAVRTFQNTRFTTHSCIRRCTI